jgi:hypothetical protein
MTHSFDTAASELYLWNILYITGAFKQQQSGTTSFVLFKSWGCWLTRNVRNKYVMFIIFSILVVGLAAVTGGGNHLCR